MTDQWTPVRQRQHSGPVRLGEVRVQPHRRRGISGEFMLQGRLARLQVVQALL